MINLYIANLGKYNEGILKGGWITLPVSEEELQEFYTNVVGLNDEYEECAIHDSETDLPITFGEYSSIQTLNAIAEATDNLKDFELDKLRAVIEWEGIHYRDILETIEILDNFNLNTNITSAEDYGRYALEDDSIPKYLENYIDYESYGQDCMDERDGELTEFGWVERC